MRSGSRDEQLLPLDLLFPKWLSRRMCVYAADNKCETICFSGNETTYGAISVCFCIYTSARARILRVEPINLNRTIRISDVYPFRPNSFRFSNGTVPRLINAEIWSISTGIFQKRNIQRPRHFRPKLRDLR